MWTAAGAMLSCRGMLLLLLCATLSCAAETPQCLEHVDMYKEGLTTAQDWAIRMYDASAKLPEGILQGIYMYFGNYDECLGVQMVAENQTEAEFVGKYCRVRLTNISLPEVTSQHTNNELDFNLKDLLGLPLKHAILNSMKTPKRDGGATMAVIRPVQFAVCVPSSCGSEGIAEVTSHNFELLLGPGSSVTAVTMEGSCEYNGDPERVLDSADWGMISLLIIFAVVICSSTLYEFYIVSKEVKSKSDFLTAFSLRTNCIQLFNAPEKSSPGTISSLHGIRTLSMAWIMLAHRYSNHTFFPIVNPNFVEDVWLRRWWNFTFLNAYVAVDTFFFMSGLLVSYVICCGLSKGRNFGFKDLPKYYIYRYIRLTAPLAVYVFFWATLAEFVSNGPMWSWHVTPRVETCQKNWWATLLYINNYYQEGGVCLGQTWYLSVDMQLAWLAPIVLLPLVKWPKPTMLLIFALILASAAAVFGVTFDYEMTWSTPLGPEDNPEAASKFWHLLYLNTPMRAQPYLFGIALGYFLSQTEKLKSLQLPKWGVVLGWVLTLVTMDAVIYTLSVSYQTDYQYNVWDAAFYASLHRIGWSLGLCWIVFACTTGRGGVVNSILSWRLFQPFSKLAYCIYITHETVIYMEGATWRNHGYFSQFTALHGFLGDVFVVVPISILLYLAVEAPSVGILRAIFQKNQPSIVKKEEKAEDDKQAQD